jgi:nucleoside-triphosphatase
MIHPVILLTGAPGVGKSTLIQNVIAQLPEHPGGFFTREVRRNGVRTAFEIVTLEGETATLATMEANPIFANEARLGEYRVNVDAVTHFAVPALERAMAQGKLVIVDEIGPMEIFSAQFCEAVHALLENQTCAVLGTIVARPYHFADEVKKHPRVHLIAVTRENRNALLSELGAKFLTVGK